MTKMERKTSANIRLDKALLKVVDKYCDANRKAGNRSDLIEEELIRLISSKGLKYGLRVPEHLL